MWSSVETGGERVCLGFSKSPTGREWRVVSGVELVIGGLSVETAGSTPCDVAEGGAEVLFFDDCGEVRVGSTSFAKRNKN